MRNMPMLPRRQVMMAAALLGAGGRIAVAQVEPHDDPWPSIATQIFNGRQLEDGSAIIGIEAPYRAEDAAIVPISIRNLAGAAETDPVRGVTLVIDQNPSPLAAVFTMGENSFIRSLSTRVRVDSYTNIHAVAQAADGRLYQAARFVKAAGGCSAPVAKQDSAPVASHEADWIPMGTMRFRQFPSEAGSKELQLMVRHPNYSGMQMDQISRLYVPADFVSTIRIWQGDDLLLTVESGISIAENPQFRFDYRPNGATEFRAEVVDSQGQIFKQSWSSVRT